MFDYGEVCLLLLFGIWLAGIVVASSIEDDVLPVPSVCLLDAVQHCTSKSPYGTRVKRWF